MKTNIPYFSQLVHFLYTPRVMYNLRVARNIGLAVLFAWFFIYFNRHPGAWKDIIDWFK